MKHSSALLCSLASFAVSAAPAALAQGSAAAANPQPSVTQQLAEQLSGLLPQPVPLSEALDNAAVTVSAESNPHGFGGGLGLRGVRLGTGVLDAEAGNLGGSARYSQNLTLPLLGYVQAGSEAQWLWAGGSRFGADGVVAAGPLEVRLDGETFTAPLLLLRPLDTLSDPTPDPRGEGRNFNASLQTRVGAGSYLRLGREWGHWAGTYGEVELRPQRWKVTTENAEESADGGPILLALTDPAAGNPDLWAESGGTLTLHVGAETRERTGAGLRLGAGWENQTSRTTFSAVLGSHSEASLRWHGFDLLGTDSKVQLGVALSDAWQGNGDLGLQWDAALLLPVSETGEVQLRGSTGAAGTAVRAVLVMPLKNLAGKSAATAQDTVQP